MTPKINFLVQVRCMTYNQNAYITETMDGFTIQETNFPFLCVIFDDASTDGAQKTILNYLKDNFEWDDNKTSFEDTINYQLYFARHKSNYNCFFAVFLLKENHHKKKDKIQYLKSEWKKIKYIAFCEGDDYWTNPFKLQKQVDILEEHPECSICVANVSLIDKNGNPIKGTIPETLDYFDMIVDTNEFMNYQIKRSLWSFHISSILVRNEICMIFNRYKKSFFKKFPYGDLPLLITCFMHGKGFYLNDFVGVYRKFSGGYSSNIIKHPDINLQNEINLVDSLLEFNKITLGKYKEYIDLRILRGQYKIVRLSKRYFEFFNFKFLPLYRYWGIKYSIISIFSDIFPTINDKLVKIKHTLLKSGNNNIKDSK